MEVMEVVCPHVFIPVLGVVFCAFLVFAFGFKSPVQPPSFDFEDDRKHKDRKSKKNKGKGSVNGHITSAVAEENSVSSKSASPIKSGVKPSTPKSTRERLPETRSPKIEKNDKKPVKKQSVKEESSNVEVSNDQGTDVDGWVTQTSRKVKKQKGKKDDRTDGSPAAGEEKTSSSDEKQEAVASLQTETELSPKGQRTGKKKRSEKNDKPSEDATKSSETKMGEKVETKQAEKYNNSRKNEKQPDAQKSEIPPETKKVEKQLEPKKPEKTSESKRADKQSEVKRSKKQSDVKQQVEVIPDPKIGKSAVAEVTSNTQPVDEEFIDVSPKKKSKSKKENKKGTSDGPTADIPKSVDSVSEVKVIPQTQAQEDPKPTKSPKKKKNKDTSTDKTEKASVEEVKGQSTTESSSIDRKSKDDSTEMTGKPSGDALLPSSAAAAEAKVEVTAAGDSAGGDQTPVTFDEMGGAAESWEAVPKSKKKRSRREN